METQALSIHDPRFDLILTPEEIAKYPEPQPSYILRLTNERQGLVYYGSHHSRDPKNPQFAEIETLFTEWAARHTPEQCVALIENSIPPQEETKELMIEKYGESGIVTWLARGSGVTCVCPEQLTEKYNTFVVEKGYSRDDLLLWIFLNTLWWQTRQQPLSDEAAVRVIKNVARAAGEVDTEGVIKDLDVQTFDSLFLVRFHDRLRELAPGFLLPASIREFQTTSFNRGEIKKLQDPSREGTVLNEIGSLINHARDRYIAATIFELLQEGKSVFAAFGWNHVFTQEPFLKKYFG